MTAPFDPVLACGAMLGALGFVGMALMWAIEGAGRANDRRQWEQERADLQAQLTEAHTGWTNAHRDGWAEGMAAAMASEDEAVLARMHAAAEAEGLSPDNARWN